jgi:hypothetical protein
MWTHWLTPLFQRNIMSPFSALDMETLCLWNVGIYLQFHMVLQPRRPTLTSSLPWEPCIEILNCDCLQLSKETVSAYNNFFVINVYTYIESLLSTVLRSVYVNVWKRVHKSYFIILLSLTQCRSLCSRVEKKYHHFNKWLLWYFCFYN